MVGRFYALARSPAVLNCIYVGGTIDRAIDNSCFLTILIADPHFKSISARSFACEQTLRRLITA